MTNANECTCPSGDGSLAHPCPAHPAVEQAGGDERAAFFKHLIGRHPAHETEIVRVVEHNHAAWKAWQARAALAQPFPAQAEAERPELWAVHAQGPDELYAAFTREDAEKHAAELNALPMPEGIAVGAVVVPSPWPEAEHWKYLAEQERDHKNEIAVRLRQFERICEGLPQDAIDGGWTVQGIRRYAKRLEDQLKVALARVAELERQGLVDAPGPDEIHQMAFEEGQPADDGDGYLFSSEEFDLFVQRLLDSCAAPPAQAQHSVPEEFSFEYRHPNGECHTVTVSREQVINEMPDFLFEALCSKFCNCEPVGETNVVECRCDEYAEEFKLLAAAPGKEGL
ncbi:hypothetical protein ABMW68_000169 [Pseudomonas aeruginosa]|uniref:hypothetical protein n=1 Tax=Pseudomonas aeruginosa TaxID=287 RepID=UPI00337CFA0C